MQIVILEGKNPTDIVCVSVIADEDTGKFYGFLKDEADSEIGRFITDDIKEVGELSLLIVKVNGYI